MISVRRVQTALLFSNSVLLFWNRQQLYFTLYAMKTLDDDLQILKFHSTAARMALLIWTYYLGYIVSVLPIGFLVHQYNTKFILLLCTLGAGIFSCLVPLLITNFDWKYFYALRLMQGLLHGCVYPAQQKHLTKWSPQAERGLASGLNAVGLNFGEAIGIYFGLMIRSQPVYWLNTFYVCGASCFGWCVFWFLYGANDCTTARYITITERRFIEHSLGDSVNFGTNKMPIPWREILGSAAFWSILIVRTANSFTYNTLLYYLSFYEKTVFIVQFSVTLYSMVPFVVRWLATYVFTLLGVWLLKQQLLSLTVQRKVFNSIGMWLPAALTLCLSFIDAHHRLLYVVVYTLLNSFNSATAIGCQVSLIDIAPNHIAILSTFVNMASKCSIILGSLLVGVIVGSELDCSKWKFVFIIIAIVFCIGDLVFLIWGTADEQSWNLFNPKNEKKPNKKDKKFSKSTDQQLNVQSQQLRKIFK